MKAILIRTSTEEQNPKNQLADCVSMAGEEAEVYEEKQSAWNQYKERVILELIKRKIKSGEIKELYVWDWDRIYRNQKKLVEFFKFCDLYKCKIHSYNQKYFEDFYKIPVPFDEIVSNLVLNLMGWLAEQESKKKSDRVKIAFKNKKGNWGRPKKIKEKLKKEVLELHNKNHSIREIAESVFYWDHNKNQKFISKSAVHKIIHEFNDKPQRNNRRNKEVSNKGRIKE